MTPKTTWLIGCAPECDLVVDKPSVSWNHCRLSQTDEGFLLEDLNSTNGTFVNGLRMLAPARVTSLDKVTLGLSVPLPWPELPKQTPAPDAQSGPHGKRVLRIGRDPDNDVVLDHAEVSGLHARVLVVPGRDRGEVEDLGSTNGTSLNAPGNPVTHAVFSRGDTIYFGPVAVPATRFLGGATAEPVDGIPLLLFEGLAITVGRDPACERVVDNPVVSSRHARLFRDGDTTFLEDLKASNGTFLNGRRIMVPTPVHPGDLIGLGQLTLRLTGSEINFGRPTSNAVSVRAAGRAVAPSAISTRLAAGFGLLVQPMLIAVLVAAAGVINAPVEDQARLTHVLVVSLFGLSVGAVWLGLVGAAVDRIARPGAAGTPEPAALLMEMALALAFGGGALVVLSGMTLGLLSARVTFAGDTAVSAVVMTLAALTGFFLGRLLIHLTGRTGVGVAIGGVLVLMMVWLGGPLAPLPQVNPGMRWAAGALPSRWSFEGLLLNNQVDPAEKTDSAAATVALAEPYFPADTERMGMAACVTALVLMVIGLAYADALVCYAIGLRARGRPLSAP